MGEKPNIRPPSVDKVARALPADTHSQRARTRAARSAVEHGRAQGGSTFEQTVAHAAVLVSQMGLTFPRRVVNMSGVILHTGLGRAPLGFRVDGTGHLAVELDLETGERGDRQQRVRELFCELTGAEDAIVVNNCAAAVLLTLRALCAGTEVVLSRGQMVEIGGSFRMPDIVQESGCFLVEVGCTNKTRIDDYFEVVTPDTCAFLRCHPSNFRVVGFTEEPSARELSDLATEHGLLLIDDVGHGCLSDFSKFGLPRERTLREAVSDGADIVLASCDKLMGGPQGGVILGKKELVERIARHPMARAVRVDKLTLAALVPVLEAYAEGQEAELPIWRYATRALELVRRDAQKLARVYKGDVVVEQGLTEMGGGSMPGAGIPTWRVGLATDSPGTLLGRLRAQDTPIIGRIEKGRVWLDPRTCEPDEVKYVTSILKGQAELP